VLNGIEQALKSIETKIKTKSKTRFMVMPLFEVNYIGF
jgi:hypothetical protein